MSALTSITLQRIYMGARAVYNPILLRNGAVSSSIRDCYLYAEYPIRLLGQGGAFPGGEASRTLIDHCHLSGSAANDATRCLDIERSQNTRITNCNFTYADTIIYGRNMSEVAINNCNFVDFDETAVDVDTVYCNIYGNNFVNTGSNATDISLYANEGGVIASNVFQVNADDTTCIFAHTSKKLSITGNEYCVLGAQSNCTFIEQVDAPVDSGAYSSYWTVTGNLIMGTGLQTGVCMHFEDIRNSYIGGNTIGCVDTGDTMANGAVPWTDANIRIDQDCNNIIDNFVSCGSAHTAIMGETIIADATNGAFTITLPTTHTFLGKQTTITIKKIDDANDVTIDGAGGDTIDGDATFDLISQYESIRIISDGNNWYII